MKVSVAVPSFNYAGFLPACLGSIAAQDHGDFEVLIADGGSTDGSLEVIERYLAADPRFRLISTRDEGQADAVQRAFAASEGALFCWLNADDCYVHTGAFRMALESLQGDPDAGLVSFGGVYLDEAGKVIRPVRLRRHRLDGLHNLSYRASVLQPATFWRREVQAAIPLRTDFHFCFDALFFWQAWQRYGWLERPETVAGYRLHGSNKSMQVRPERVAELARFEAIKFGPRSLRGHYLAALASVLRVLQRVPWLGRLLLRGAYVVNNSLSFATAHRWPGI